MHAVTTQWIVNYSQGPLRIDSLKPWTEKQEAAQEEQARLEGCLGEKQGEVARLEAERDAVRLQVDPEPFSASFLLLSSLELSHTFKSAPPRNRSTFLLGSCSWIENYIGRGSKGLWVRNRGGWRVSCPSATPCAPRSLLN